MGNRTTPEKTGSPAFIREVRSSNQASSMSARQSPSAVRIRIAPQIFSRGSPNVASTMAPVEKVRTNDGKRVVWIVRPYRRLSLREGQSCNCRGREHCPGNVEPGRNAATSLERMINNGARTRSSLPSHLTSRAGPRLGSVTWLQKQQDNDSSSQTTPHHTDQAPQTHPHCSRSSNQFNLLIQQLSIIVKL